MSLCCCWKKQLTADEAQILLKPRARSEWTWEKLEQLTATCVIQISETSRWIDERESHRSRKIRWLKEGIITSGYPNQQSLQEFFSWLALNQFLLVDLTTGRTFRRTYLKGDFLISRCVIGEAMGLHYQKWEKDAVLEPVLLHELVKHVKEMAIKLKVNGLWIHSINGTGRTGMLVSAIYLYESIKAIQPDSLRESLVNLILNLREQQGVRNFVDKEAFFDSLVSYGEFLLKSLAHQQ